MSGINFSSNLNNNLIEKLSVVVSADSFLYGWVDSDSLIQKFAHIPSFDYSPNSDKLDDLRSDLNKYAVNKIIVCSKQPPSLHLHKIDDHLPNYFPSFEEKRVFREKFTGEEVFTYFGLNPVQLTFLDTMFNTYSLHHFSLVLANYYYPAPSEGLHADFGTNNLHIFFSELNGFKFYNSFEFNTNEDVLYYILAVYKHLGLDPLNEKLHLSGLIDARSPLYRLIHGYVAYIQFKNAFPCLPVSIDERSPDHYYFDIGATSLCV